MVMRPMSLVTNSGATVPEAPVSGTVQRRLHDAGDLSHEELLLALHEAHVDGLLQGGGPVESRHLHDLPDRPAVQVVGDDPDCLSHFVFLSCVPVCPSRTPVRDEIALKKAWRRAASRPTPSLVRVNAMIDPSQRHD